MVDQFCCIIAIEAILKYMGKWMTWIIRNSKYTPTKQNPEKHVQILWDFISLLGLSIHGLLFSGFSAVIIWPSVIISWLAPANQKPGWYLMPSYIISYIDYLAQTTYGDDVMGYNHAWRNYPLLKWKSHRFVEIVLTVRKISSKR